MRQVRFAIVAFALALAACETVPVSGPTAPSGPASIPSSQLDLGDWRSASPGAALTHFQETIAARYGAGLAISAIAADMRRNDFSCAPPNRGDGRGDPPVQVCRKTATASSCTHTWQVHLFDAGDDGRLARTRALYDRRCGGDGLLGGPGK